MMQDIIDIVLLLALPASGKSEVRNYLDSLSDQECRTQFHMGETVQLDDYPYVHFMRRIDEELEKLGQPYIYFNAPDKNFQDPRQWGTLIEMVNWDYRDLFDTPPLNPPSPARFLFWRLDMARQKVGGDTQLNKIPHGIMDKLADRLEEEAGKILRDKRNGIPENMEGKTVVIEFARGGPDGSSMPLSDPLGYQYSLRQLDPAILERAAILYIWVTPEESRRKNVARTDPNDPGSILNHGVPEYVMFNDYGCDDMDHLEAESDRPNTVTVDKNGESYYLPVGRFDNRVDLTTFLRQPRDQWSEEDTTKLRKELEGAFERLWGQYKEKLFN